MNHILHNTRACACYPHLRRLRSIRTLLDHDVTVQLTCALVLSPLNYCNVVFARLLAATLVRPSWDPREPLQQVLHSAARLIYEVKPSDQVTLVLKDVHWLPI